jgi:hypothetical protein
MDVNLSERIREEDKMTNFPRRCCVLLLGLFVVSSVHAGEVVEEELKPTLDPDARTASVTAALLRTEQVYADFPKEIHASERYVIYSHGRIVEGNDEKPMSPDFGLYDFPAVRRALFDGGGFNLIAYQRPKDIGMEPSIALLESWVRKLVEAGVKPSRITLVGFSRGGHITARVSANVHDLGINTAILAICQDGDLPEPRIELGGHVLSVYETTDVVGSCAKLGSRGPLESFEEIAITTGRRHGAFFQPLPEWIMPLKDWIARTNR